MLDLKIIVVVIIIFASLIMSSFQATKKSKIETDFYERIPRKGTYGKVDPFVIETENGFVRGSKMTDKMYGFRGIPFAKPPLGDLRFEAPQKPDNWTGILDVTRDKSECMQLRRDYSIAKAQIVEIPRSEDCLYLNIYLPQLPTGKNATRAVLFYIYGGTFLNGGNSYDLHGPDYLVQKDIIVVIPNYRGGIFGFLSTGDNVMPGNGGLKDIVLAMKWVQTNIHQFGGNPQNVTLIGISSGAALASYLVASPLARGLFQQAIIESGSLLCSWALSKTAKQAAVLVGTTLGITTNSSSELVKYLKTIEPYRLMFVTYGIMAYLIPLNLRSGLVFGPVIEPNHPNAVISTYGYELLKQGNFNRVPVMIGFNSGESLMYEYVVDIIHWITPTIDLFPKILVPTMNAKPDFVNKIGEKIREHYAGSNGRIAYPKENFMKYLSDDLFVRPTYKMAKLMTNFVTVFLYKFSFKMDPDALGAAHAAELPYLWKSKISTIREVKLRNNIVKLWTNFVKFGNPTPTVNTLPNKILWTPITPETKDVKNYIDIGDTIVAGTNPNAVDMDFWDKLYKKYGHPPYYTY